MAPENIYCHFLCPSVSSLKVVSHCHSFQHSEWQIEGQTHGWRANWRAKWGSHWHSPLQFFSALCPPYTLHQTLLWSHTGRLCVSLKMSPDEKSAERNTSNHHVWMSNEWQWESLHFLQSALLVWKCLHSISSIFCFLLKNVFMSQIWQGA